MAARLLACKEHELCIREEVVDGCDPMAEISSHGVSWTIGCSNSTVASPASTDEHFVGFDVGIAPGVISRSGAMLAADSDWYRRRIRSRRFTWP